MERLQKEPAVRLGDVTPDKRPDRNTYSPLAFSEGTVLYDLTTAVPPASQAAFAPFELFRQPLLVIAITDAQEYQDGSDDAMSSEEDAAHQMSGKNALVEVQNAVDSLGDQLPQSLATVLVAMDCSEPEKARWLACNAICVPQTMDSTSTTTKTAMCDVTSKFLAELAVYGNDVKGWTNVPTPTVSQPTMPKLTPSQRHVSDRQVSLQGQSPRRDDSPRPDSIHRAAAGGGVPRDYSSPVSSAASSPRPESPAVMAGPAHLHNDVATSTNTEGLWRSNSKYGPVETERSTSRSVFPVSSSQANADRERNIGKTRVGIVLGSLYLMAGRWPDAWRELLEHTARARALGDWLWHAKGLENVFACMLVIGWAGFDFQIPAMSHTGSERSSSVPFADATKDLSTTLGPQDPISATQTLRKLGSLLPEIAVTILRYHDRAGLLNGESVHQVMFSETVLRLCRVLAVVASDRSQIGSRLMGPELSSLTLEALAGAPGTKLLSGFSKVTVAETLFRAYPGPLIGLSLIEKTSVLAGIASVLSLLGLERKRAAVMKDLLGNLIPALFQARKLGAAEMGIHPAASLSFANGPSDNLGSDRGPPSVQGVFAQLQAIYAVDDVLGGRSPEHSALGQGQTQKERRQEADRLEDLIDAAAHAAASSADFESRGSLNLKIDILRACIEFCDALPDLRGIIYTTALLLRTAGPHAAIVLDPRSHQVTLSTEEQVRLLSNMSRAANALARAGIANTEATYWDDFLVRNVVIYEQEHIGRLIEHSNVDLQAQRNKGPFLHDAFAKQAAGAVSYTHLTLPTKRIV